MNMNILSRTLKAALLLTVCGLSSCGGGGKARVPTDIAGNLASPGGSGHPVPSPTPPSAPPPPVLPPLEPPFPEPTPPSPTPSCEKVVFRDGFWTGTINVDRVNYDQNDYTWTELPLEMPGKSTATVVADPAGSGQLVGRFMVPDDGESFRAEVHRRRFDWGHYRYAISHYIPSDFARFRYDTIISQWHGYPMQDANGKNVSLNPPIALSVYGADPRWVLNTNLLASTNPPKAATTRHPIDVPIAYDRWNDWVFDITWSRLLADGTVTPGLIVVTLNGQEVLRIAGDNNYHQQWPPYFQMGIYRPNWRAGPNRGPSGGPPVVVYHGNLSVTDLNGCTAASAP